MAKIFYYKLAVSVKSQFEEKVAQARAYTEENVASSLFVGTRQTLSSKPVLFVKFFTVDYNGASLLTGCVRIKYKNHVDPVYPV